MWLRRLSLFFALFVSSAHATVCESGFKALKLSEVIFTQDGLRRSPEEMQRLRVRLQASGGTEKGALKINLFEDGTYYLRDGHHHATIYRENGVESLPEGSYVLENYSYAKYGEVNFADGWITPFNPQTDLRLAELAGWRSLISRMISKGVPKPEIEKFIRAHPEAYSKPRSKTETAKDGEGTTRDRALYNAMMDRTLPVKIGHLSANVPQSGVIYEVGAGSGALSALFALENPHLLVVVSDTNIEAVRAIQRNYPLPNLVVLKADAREKVFPDRFLDGIHDSSVVHEIMSYSGMSEQAVSDYHKAAFAQTEVGGSYTMRDFVVPESWPEKIHLWLSSAPSNGKSEFAKMSKADLFRHFAENFRSHDFKNGIPFEEVSSKDGGVVFEVSREAATNFLLRISYVEGDSWLHEMREQYTYETSSGVRRELESHGYRIDLVSPVQNPFIERNFWNGKAKVTDSQGRPLDWPATNLLAYVTRPGGNEPIKISISPVSDHSPRVLSLAGYKNLKTGQIFDLVEMPGVYRTFVPYQVDGDETHVFIQNKIRMGGLIYYGQNSTLDETHYGGFSSKAPGMIVRKPKDWRTDFADMLAKPEKRIGAFLDADSSAKITATELKPFMPSPGGSNEVIEMRLVDMKGTASKVFDQTGMRRYRWQDALNSLHLGSIADPRLEYALYELGRKQNLLLPRWLGGDFELKDQSVAKIAITEDESFIAAKPLTTPQFQKVDSTSGFMKIDSQRLEVIFEGKKEYEIQEFAVPAKTSLDSFVVVPVIRSGDKVYIGFEGGDRAALETRGWNAIQRVLPAWRMPKNLHGREEALTELKRKMNADFKLTALSLNQLAASYFSSPQQSPERVTIILAEVDAEHPPEGLVFVPEEIALKSLSSNPDLHTKVGLLRFNHAMTATNNP